MTYYITIILAPIVVGLGIWHLYMARKHGGWLRNVLVGAGLFYFALAALGLGLKLLA